MTLRFKYHSAMFASLLALSVALAACGSGETPSESNALHQSALPVDFVTASGGSTSNYGEPDAAPLMAEPIPPPASLRQIFVDQASPAANDANPGTAAHAPLRTIGQAMKLLRAGDDVVIGPGTYREAVVVPTLAQTSAPTTIRAREPGKTIVKGSDAVSGWIRTSSDSWAIDWSGAEPEQVFRSGVPLQQIGGTVFSGFPLDPTNPLNGAHVSEGGIWPGRIAGDKRTLPLDAFTFQADERRIYVRLSKELAENEALEVSTQLHVFYAPSATGLNVRDLVFEHSNTSLKLRHGGVYIAGASNIISGVVVRRMDAFCLMVSGDDSQILRSKLTDCGQAGLAAYGSRIMIDDNRVFRNNTRGFNTQWEAGGMKFTGAPSLTESTISNNIVAFNEGDGIWFDWTPNNISVRGNITAYNKGHGIHFEASETGMISNNISYGNGKRGIYLLESSGSVIQANSVFLNYMEGIIVANGSRSSSDLTLLPLKNQVIGNTTAWNDQNRNRIQLMLPGLEFANVSENNIIVDRILPRFAQGWPSATNKVVEGLVAWRVFSYQDNSSLESIDSPPAKISDLVVQRKLIRRSDLPPVLRYPGAAGGPGSVGP